MHLSYLYNGSKKSLPKKGLKQKKKKSFSFLKVFFVFFLLCFLGGAFAFIGLVAWYSRDLPNPNKLLFRSLPLSTKIYDRTGEHLLYEIHGDQQRTFIPLQDIPDTLVKATLAAEDRGFYTHKGFDVKGIIRALIIDFFTGRRSQGGSTITQQFIKNALLTNKKTFGRKIKELILAYELEKKFTKDQILQLYFNEIPYGSTVYGAQTASRYYFNKDIHSLTLGESALLAILPRAPTYYSPWGQNKEKLFERQKNLLDIMVELGMVRAVDAEKAKNEKIVFKGQIQQITAPHFVMYIKDQLEEQYGQDIVREGGLSVLTTLDYTAQRIAEDAVTKQGKINLSFGAQNAALVSLDAKTGEILSLVGSRDYFDESIDGNVDVVLRKRQPGSSFKPIVYAKAFEKGFTPQTILFDVGTNFDTSGEKSYIPKNYNGKEYGPVSMRQALAGSLNIASVKTLYLVGVPQVIEFAKKLGYSSLKDQAYYGLALVLGGAEVTLLEHAAAYTSFAQEGIRVEPVSILRITDKQQQVLFEFKNPKKEEVFNKEVARNINDILSDNSAREFIFGKKNHLQLSDRPAGVKTGTTNDNRDAWTIGYTPSRVTGVWVGNNDNTPMKAGADGSRIAAPIWNEYMTKVLKNTPPENFTKPLPIKTGKNILDGIMWTEVNDTLGENPSTTSTLGEQIKKSHERVIHTILYSINKDDPRGDTPKNPSDDPQYREWEQKIQEWLTKNKLKNSELILEDQEAQQNPKQPPSLSLISPQENETITSPYLTTSLTTTSLQGIDRVEYYLDNQFLDAVSLPPYALSYQLSGFENGFHTLQVKSYDTQNISQSISLNLNFLLTTKNTTLSLTQPTHLARLSLQKNIPYSFSFITPQQTPPQDIKRITLSLNEKKEQTQKVLITLLNPGTKIIKGEFTPPQKPGLYFLTLSAYNLQSTLITQKKILLIFE